MVEWELYAKHQTIVAARIHVFMQLAITTATPDVVEQKEQLDVRWFQARMVKDVALDTTVLILMQQKREPHAVLLLPNNNMPFNHIPKVKFNV